MISQWWADSRGKVIVLLLLLWIFAPIFRLQPGIAVAFMVLVDFVLSRHITLSTIVTGLLIGLIFDPTAGILPILAACIFASLSKNFLRNSPHNHIFNPAAFGIFTASLLFQRQVSWWGTSWGIIPVLILAIGMTPVLLPFRRFWMPITFLAIYFFITRSVQLLFDGTVFLFAFVMLPEPKTAPKIGLWQYGWGLLVASFVFAESIFNISFVDPLLFALLAANFVGFLWKRYTLIR